MSSTAQIPTSVTRFVHRAMVNLFALLRYLSRRFDPNGGHDLLQLTRLTVGQRVVDVVILGTFDLHTSDVVAILGFGSDERRHSL